MMKFALLLSGLLLVACHNQSTTALQSRNLLAQGIDLPTDASNALNEIRDSKLDFVARYYRSPASRWPPLTAIEAQRLSSVGVNIVAVWEWHSHDPAYFSYASGYSDAISAYTQAKAVGQPAGSAIILRWTTMPRAAISAPRSTSISAGSRQGWPPPATDARNTELGSTARALSATR